MKEKNKNIMGKCYGKKQRLQTAFDCAGKKTAEDLCISAGGIYGCGELTFDVTFGKIQ